jgi:hypothetical protein
MSKEQYEAMKSKEKSKTLGKNLAVQGVTTFKSRALDARAADEAKAQGEAKKYRFPDKTTGNKDNYVRAVGGRDAFRNSKDYENMLKEKEAELQRSREASAKISGASGGVRSMGAKKQVAAKAPAPAAKPAGGFNLFGLFGKKD